MDWLGRLACWLLGAAYVLPLFAADSAPPARDPESICVSPRMFGLDLDPGPVVAGGRCVTTRDGGSEAAVARVHVQVGDHLILLLPNGQLIARSAAECVPTEQAFEPLSQQQMLEQLQETSFAGWRNRRTRHYLYLFNGSEEFANVTSRILETMFSGVVMYARAQKVEVSPPELPLVVIIFATREQFQAYRRMPEGVTAYYDVLTNHILLCEESELWQVKPDLAIRQTIATIAHEGAHQVLHNIGVQQRLSQWPMWLNEGLAEFFAATTTDRQLKWKGAGEVNDLRMFELEQLIKSLAGEAVKGQVVAQTVGAAKLTSTGYATAWGLTHYLAKNQRESFHAFVREMSRRQPLEGGGEVLPPGVITGNLRDFKRHFGEDLPEVERRLVLHLRNLPYQDPFADWPHFVACVTFAADGQERREVDIYHRKDRAERWWRERLVQEGAKPEKGVKPAVREFPNRLAAEHFAQQWLQGRAAADLK